MAVLHACCFLLTYLVKARKQGQSCKGVCGGSRDMASPCPQWAWGCWWHVRITTPRIKHCPLGSIPAPAPPAMRGRREDSTAEISHIRKWGDGAHSSQCWRSSSPTNPPWSLSVPAAHTCTCSLTFWASLTLLSAFPVPSIFLDTCLEAADADSGGFQSWTAKVQTL